ncbi:Asp23/Gls24 family envelope stress response protein [Natronosporangium hydrolyticum]|uniref:Asp23/Gls24 family envelope stress response protein n=1 Tax=Natronosporangium hydrolyticum TaxID=2811111 RepID=A0A895YNB4_9ACTN|nr:Asp23/Gls24 family envelope stress response protein [Natronosporangium hydrolyticum]QSB15418.1 Asp23/Gls24 family envelope stress response protein [Natronosporangium hydrolyticum]
MSAPTRERSGGETGRSTESNAATGRAHSELVTEHGKTTIADSVVEKIVGMAAREVPGVYAMGAGFSRAVGMVRERVSSGSSAGQGVAVEVGEREAAVDIDIIVDYGVSIPDLAAGIRRNVVAAVQKMCGLEVNEVNISVGDVHLPDESTDDESAEPRVR